MHRSCAGRNNLTLSIMQDGGASFPRVVVVVWKPSELERLVAERVFEQLSGSTRSELPTWHELERRIRTIRALVLQGEVSLEVAVGLEADGRVEARSQDLVGITDSADVVISPDEAISVLRGVSPVLANDLKGRSPQDINFAINIYLAILQTLQILLMLYQMAHDQPPTQTQIIEIFNQTTTVVNQTINMPPPPPTP